MKKKSIEEREKIAIDLKVKIASLGIPDCFDGIEEFHKILNEYCKPNIFGGFSGSIKLLEIERNLEYILPLAKHAAPVVKLTAFTSF
jgi:hypothetical protein